MPRAVLGHILWKEKFRFSSEVAMNRPMSVQFPRFCMKVFKLRLWVRPRDSIAKVLYVPVLALHLCWDQYKHCCSTCIVSHISLLGHITFTLHHKLIVTNCMNKLACHYWMSKLSLASAILFHWNTSYNSFFTVSCEVYNTYVCMLNF